MPTTPRNSSWSFGLRHIWWSGPAGARVALDLIRRYPRLVKGAVLSEPPVLALAPDGGAAFLAPIKPAVEAALVRGEPRAVVDAFFEIVCPGLWRALPEERRDVPYCANAAGLFGDLAMPFYQIAPADLAQIRVPSLIVCGSESDPTLRAIAGILAEHIPGARLVELSSSGHVTYAEQPEAFAPRWRHSASGCRRCVACLAVSTGV